MGCETMPFGRYKGRLIEDIPAAYLEWVLRECDNAAPWLIEAIEDELLARHTKARRVEAAAFDGLEALLTRVVRELALKHHPDRGGNGDIMRGINLAVERLREVLEESSAA